MDRFIDMPCPLQAIAYISLKSNMDRFIEIHSQYLIFQI